MPTVGPQGLRASVPPMDRGESAEHFMRWYQPALWVFLIYLGVHLFIFRDIIFALPDLLTGRSVLNTSELVPFFDPATQFFEQAGGAFSDLTNTFEFRIRYSLLTTWMRYYLILPFAVIFVPMLGAFLACLLISDFLRRLLPSTSPKRILYATALTTLLIHFILLPAKVTHFYTLVLGFDIFIISLVLFLQSLLLEPKHPVILLLAASVVALANPAVHFQVLYPFTVVFTCAVAALLLLISVNRHSGSTDGKERGVSLRLWKRMLFAIVFTMLFTVLPYVLFIKFYVLQGVGNLKDIVPDTFAAIKASSISLLHQMSFDTSSATGNYLRGGYLPPVPRFGKLFYFILALIPFIATATTIPQEKRRLRAFLILMGLLMLFSMWCSIGYAETLLIPTFHSILAAFFRKLYVNPGQFAEISMRVITETIHVLRFPDRFQFIFFAIMALLMPIGVLTIEQQCGKRFAPRFRLGRTAGTIISCIVFFLPLFAHWEYRSALLSGDMGGFLRPYSVSHLRAVKDALQTLPPGKTVVLPPSESQWIGQNNNAEEYKFIDKFFIYFLNNPSYYIGLTGNLDIKEQFFFLFQSLEQNEHWWINILRNLRIRYLVINKEMRSPSPGPWYLQSIMRSITQQPAAMPQFFKKLMENDGFVLFEFIDPQRNDATPLLSNMDWNDFRCIQERSLTFTREHRIIDLSASESIATGSTLTVLGKDSEKARLDLYVKDHPQTFFRPDPASFAFTADHLPSTQYFGTVFSMLNLLTGTTYNIFRIVMPGPFDTFSSFFVGLIQPTTIRFPVTVSKNGTYSIFLRGIPTQHHLTTHVDRGLKVSALISPESSPTHYVTTPSASFGIRSPVASSTVPAETLGDMIPKKIMPVSVQFSYIHLGTFDLTEGRHLIFLTKSDANPLMVEGILLLPVQKQVEQPLLERPVRFFDPQTIE